MSNPAQLLKGKSTAITGGVTGIGRAIALGYVAHGANVAVNHFGDATSAAQFQTLLEDAARILGSEEEAQQRVAEVPGDVGDPETGKKLVAEVVRRWGRLDVVVSNAGICEFKEFLECVLTILRKGDSGNWIYVQCRR
jgi:L-rhamnose 1-dehydrogenase